MLKPEQCSIIVDLVVFRCCERGGC